MGFFKWLFGNSDSTSKQDTEYSIPEVKTGQLLSGTITSIKPTFAFARANSEDFFIHISDIIDVNSRHKDLNDYLTLDQEVEFVPVKKDDQGWKGSILIAQRFREREQLRDLRKRVFKGKDLRIKDFSRAGLILEYEDNIEIRISKNELPVALQKKNTIREIRSLIKDGSLKIKKTGMFPPKDQIYTYNLKGKNEAYLTGTIQNLDYVPSQETVDIVTHTYPFRLEVSAIRPYELDTVMEFVLRAIGEESSPDRIAQITALKESTLEEIREKLEQLNYMKGWDLTRKAKLFLEAVQQEEIINEHDFGGYFASAAHPMHEIIRNTASFEKIDSKDNGELFAKDRHAWEDFINKTDRDLSYSFLKNIVEESHTEALTEAVMSDTLRIYIRKARKPDAKFLVPTPLDWFYGGLLSHFNPLSEIPERIVVPESYCTTYCLIKYDVTHSPVLLDSASVNGLESKKLDEKELIKNVFYETNTNTFWRLNHNDVNVFGPNKSVIKSPIDKSFEIYFPDGERLEAFRNPRIKFITNL